jgi:hypothetical protein
MSQTAKSRHAAGHWFWLEWAYIWLQAVARHGAFFALFELKQGEHQMGYLMRGAWVDQWYDTASSDGRFVRHDSRFRSWVGDNGD